MSIDISTYLTYLKAFSLNPETYSTVSGMPTTEVYDNVFAKNYKVSSAEEMLRSFFTKTIPVVSYRAKGGKWQPVGKDSVNIEKIQVPDIKLTTTIDADEIKNFMLLWGSLKDSALSSLQGVYNDKINTFNLIKRKMVLSQCSEFMGTGIVTFQIKNDDGLIYEYAVNYTTMDGAIASSTYSGGAIHDWSSSSTTAVNILDDIEFMRETGFTNSGGSLFKKGSPLLLFAGTTAYSYAVGKFRTTDTLPVMRRIGTSYSLLGDVEVPIIKSSFTKEYLAPSTTTSIQASTSAAKLGAKEIMLVDNSAGNFGVTDLKFVNLANVDRSITTPFTVTFEQMKHEQGVEIAYATKPIVHGRTKALYKGTICA